MTSRVCGVVGFALLVMSLTGQQVQAFIDLPVSLKPIEGANLVCEDSGVAYFINSTDQRVWQSDPGESVGIELSVAKFAKGDCERDCFQIEGSLSMLGETVYLDIITGWVWHEVERWGERRAKVRLWGRDPADYDQFELPCRAIGAEGL